MTAGCGVAWRDVHESGRQADGHGGGKGIRCYPYILCCAAPCAIIDSYNIIVRHPPLSVCVGKDGHGALDWPSIRMYIIHRQCHEVWWWCFSATSNALLVCVTGNTTRQSHRRWRPVASLGTAKVRFGLGYVLSSDSPLAAAAASQCCALSEHTQPHHSCHRGVMSAAHHAVVSTGSSPSLEP